MHKQRVIICLLNFLVAALMGLTLRFAFVQSIPLNYRFLTHGHSHVAMLGWVYLMLYTLIVHHFISEEKPIYNRLFWLTEFAVIGMMISFPIQGYAAVSIGFSSLHIFCSYYFVRLIWKNHQINSIPARYLLKASLLFMLLSTIGVWCLGPAAAMLGQTSAVFQIAIQFFLHFQFNGWFLLAILAVFFNQFDIKNIKLFKCFFILMLVATLLTFSLPISWYAFHPILLWMNGFGVLIQIFALYLFFKLLQPHWQSFWTHTSKSIKLMYRFALICFVLKISIQSLSILPEVAQMAYQTRNFVIGFIHLTMLGVITGFLIAFLLQSELTNSNSTILTLSLYSFIAGFLTTELLLFVQGFLYYFGFGMAPNYYQLLFACSILLPLGILLFIINIYKHDIKTFKTT